jgi:hypothetical protein
MRHRTTLAVLAALLPSLQVHAGDPPLPDDRLGMRTVPLLLLSRPDVRADLKLTSEQARAADHAIAELYAKAAALRGKTGPEVIAARRKIDEEQARWIEHELSAEQVARLGEIDLQWEGPSALLSRPKIGESLGLTDAQRQGLAQAVEVRNRHRVKGRPAVEVEHQLAEQALAILNTDQKGRWKALLGRPFVVQTAAANSAPQR